MLQSNSKTIFICRKLVQTGFALYSLYIGIKFYDFFLWATGQSQVYVPRPASVEAFLPISALIGLKHFILTGVYDYVHPAGLTIFISVIIISFLFRRGFCGWICPVGFLSELLGIIGSKLKIQFRLVGIVAHLLYSIKYLLLFFFLYMVLWKMDLQQINAFLQSPYNLVVDGKMLLFFITPSKISIIVLGLLAGLSLLFRNFWCRFLCPYGALLGLTALLSPTSIKRDRKRCIGCKSCSKTCPASIDVDTKERIRVPECIGCMECIGACGDKKSLTVTIAGFAVNPLIIGIGSVLFFLGAWLIGYFSGHWNNSVPPFMWKRFYSIFF